MSTPRELMVLAQEDITVHGYLQQWLNGNVEFQGRLIGLIKTLLMEKANLLRALEEELATKVKVDIPVKDRPDGRESGT